MKVAVAGDVLYDVATKNTIIAFNTEAVWPYQLDDGATMVGSWQKSASNSETGVLFMQKIIHCCFKYYGDINP